MPAPADRTRYRLSFAVTGRIRFLSHLETMETLLGAVRRAGLVIALGDGPKPKPRISLAMPRPVGVEGWQELCEIELRGDVDASGLSDTLNAAMPDGIRILDVHVVDATRKYIASRVAGATYRFTWTAPALDAAGIGAADVHAAATHLAGRGSLVVRRSTPKQDRDVDVRDLIGEIESLDASDGGVHVRVYLPLATEGSARPQEVKEALDVVAGRSLPRPLVARESIAASATGTIAEPALVGAEVPPDPEKPWGAC